VYVGPVEATFDQQRLLHAQLPHYAGLDCGCATGLVQRQQQQHQQQWSESILQHSLPDYAAGPMEQGHAVGLQS
jgi:hypothetical protein